MKKLLLIALLSGTLSAFSQSYTSKQYKADFTYFWNTIDSNYCYFEKKQVDWDKLRDIYSSQIDTVSNRDGFISVLERAMYELYDHHCGLSANTKTSRRLVPTSADMWAEFSGDKAVITEVRKGYGAEKAGIIAGMEVISINDVPVKEAILPFLGHTVNAESKSFALRLALNGDHVTKRKITLKTASGTKDFYPDRDGMLLEIIHFAEMVESKDLGDMGYIRINNFLYDNALIPKFDSVLNTMLSKRALIIDMRETASGGNTAVARAILGRFIDQEHLYQKHELYAEELETGIKRSWVEIVSPRKNPYLKPVVILADHWTGSISEGITVAFDGMKRATVIGTQLARLNGAVYSFEMPNTKIGFNISEERLYHVNGTPRELFNPTITVDVTKQRPGEGGDVILNSAMDFLKNKLK
ncbi:MAG TPA: S41 family peptidase [Mucilaginibacter sp.]|nr:S41 family peptidase [Mucilaginibacter sp.]